MPATARHAPFRRLRTRLVALALLPGGVAGGEFLSLQRYGLDEGLSQTTVTALAEDPLGLLWVGTQDGLNRFDGQRFVVQRRQPGQLEGLVSSSIDSLAVDADGRLWVGSNDGGLEVIDPRDGRRWRLGEAEGLAHPTVSRLLADGNGGAWLGSPRGLAQVDSGLNAARSVHEGAAIVALAGQGSRRYALDQRCGVLRLDGHTAQPHGDLRRSRPGLRCVGLAVDGTGLWIASRDEGLFRLGHDGQLQQHTPAAQLLADPVPLNTLFQRRDGHLLLGYVDGRIVIVDAAGRAAEARLDAPLGSAITLFFEHSSGVLFVGTHSAGLLRMRVLSRGLRDPDIDAATMAGWRDRNVYALWRDAGHWLVGTETGLLQRKPGGAWERVDTLGASAVRRILARPGGGWLIGSHDGVWQLTAEGAARRYGGDYDPRITDLLDDPLGTLVATRDGLYRLREGIATQQDVPAELRRGFFTALERSDDGALWIGSNEQGLWRLAADGGLTRYRRANGGLVHDSVWALHADAEAIWVGTYSGGLQRLDRRGGPGRVYGEREGLSNNVVYRIETDAERRLWLSTNRGISVLDPRSGVVQVLLRGDGLRNREFNAGASFRDDRGVLHFGGIDGVDVIDPQALPASSAAASPVPGELLILGRRGVASGAGALDRLAMQHRQRVELDWRDSVFALDMVALDFTAPDSARLRYRLLGIAEDWVYPASPHAELLLSYLPPGDYRLEFAAAGRDGRFGPPRHVDIVLPAPPWRGPWAYAGYSLLGIAALALLWRRQRQRVAARQAQIAQLNRMVAERTQALEHANRLLRQSNAQLDLAGRTDPLTQASNRRDLQEWLPQARGDGRALLFCMVDIDDFKHINDTHGHRAGDEVLVRFAERLRGLCRDRDMLVRWGGEEFLLVLRDTRPEDAPLLMERLRHQVADAPMRLADGTSIPVTCSAGFARWPFSASLPELGDWEQSVALADRALYRAKRAGKNGWAGWLEGPGATAAGVEQLLGGAPPEQLAEGCCILCAGPAAAQPVER